MGATANKHKSNLQSYIITTGVSSLNYYNEYMQSFEKSNSVLYNYMKVGSIKNIAMVDDYKVVVDLCDNNIKEIVFELFNYLLPFNVNIHVKLIYNIALSSDDIDQCMSLLNRLDKYKLINLEIINKSSEVPKEKEVNSWIKKLKNIFFFTGVGNTGKTSLISVLSELCNDKGHRVALIDLTENNKLSNYFTNIHPLIGTNFQHDFFEERIKDNKEKTINVYTYDYKKLINSNNEKAFCESIKKIGSIYDYVFINSDINTVLTKSEIFNIGEKVFIVHDFMPTKINSTKQILLKFEEAGINTKGNISLIYNKMVKCYFNIGYIEERMIFKKVENKGLMPLVDLNCETFEIPYSKKTMGAMINNISHKSSMINNVAYSYRRNTNHIYQYINKVSYVEIGDVDIIEYGKNSLNNIVKHTYIKNIKQEAYKCMEYMKKRKKIALQVKIWFASVKP